MQNQVLKHFHTNRWFYFFLCTHIVLWTVIPALVRYNLPLDSIEGTIWGHQLQWGYDKNPYLNGWLTAFATFLDGQSGWMIYLFSQLSVGVCFWSVWRLAKKMLPPASALLSVLMLEGIQYYTFHSIDFNDNTCELGLWALASYCFYQSLRTPPQNRLRFWILTGLTAGLGVMAKYYTIALLASMSLFLIIDKTNRKQLTTLPPYIGLCVFLGLILPHIVWLFYHDFITVTYVFQRASSPPSWTNHVVFPAKFAYQQLQAFIPAVILMSILFPGKKSQYASTPPQQKETISSYDKSFLMYVGLGPFLLTMALSLLLGIKLRAGWGMPLLSLWGILLVAFAQPYLMTTKMYRFYAVVFSSMFVLIGCYVFSLIDSRDTSSANFPGREIAQTITKTWHENYHTPLAYVAGSRWVGGNIGFYSKDRPSVFIEWNKQRAPWVDIQKLQKKGAVFIWAITDNEIMPPEIRQQFPRLQKTTFMEFSWRRNKHHLPPIKIGMAILPPEPFLSKERA